VRPSCPGLYAASRHKQKGTCNSPGAFSSLEKNCTFRLSSPLLPLAAKRGHSVQKQKPGAHSMPTCLAGIGASARLIACRSLRLESCQIINAWLMLLSPFVHKPRVS
jgi:hypothetical protein